jgi:hypothetical protein
MPVVCDLPAINAAAALASSALQDRRHLRTVSDKMHLVLVLVFAFTLICRAGDKATGRWEGVVHVPDRGLTLVVDLEQSEGGSWRGSVIIPSLNIKGAPLTDISAQGAQVSFAIQAMSGPTIESPRVKARLSDGKLTGEFLQGGNTAPFVLEKIGPPQVEPQPRSTTIAKEFEGEWKGEYELLGYPRKVTLKLQSHGSEPATAELVIVGRKVNNVPVDRITQQGDFITMESAAFGMTYEGRIKNNEIQGQLLQGPIEIALVLRRPQ